MTSISTIWKELSSILSKLNNFHSLELTRSTTSSVWKFQLNNLAVKGLIHIVGATNLYHLEFGTWLNAFTQHDQYVSNILVTDKPFKPSGAISMYGALNLQADSSHWNHESIICLTWGCFGLIVLFSVSWKKHEKKHQNGVLWCS